MAKRSRKPSDFSIFAASVYRDSATLMEFEDWFDCYEEIIRLVFWNPEIDMQIAIQSQDKVH